MTRVAVTVEQFWHKVPGGTGWATAQTLKALAVDSDFSYVGLAARHRSPSSSMIPEAVPVSFAGLPRPALYEAWLRSGMGSVESIVGDPVDVVWASAMVVPPTNAPVVVTVHDLDFLDHPEWLSKRGKGFFPRAWRAATERAALMVCPSETVAQACEARGVEAGQVRVVPWGVDAQRVDEQSANMTRASFGLPDRFAIWVGTLEPRKNLERVVQAVSQVDGLHLAIVGPDGWSVDHESVIAPLGDRAHKLGRVSQDELAALYAAATVFVFPSLAEGFGLPVLEAMAQGTPVVTSVGTGTEDASQGAALLVNPKNVSEIADAIRSVISNDQTASSLRTAGLAVAKNSSWAKTAAGYRKIFGEVAR